MFTDIACKIQVYAMNKCRYFVELYENARFVNISVKSNRILQASVVKNVFHFVMACNFVVDLWEVKAYQDISTQWAIIVKRYIAFRFTLYEIVLIFWGRDSALFIKAVVGGVAFKIDYKSHIRECLKASTFSQSLKTNSIAIGWVDGKVGGWVVG